MRKKIEKWLAKKTGAKDVYLKKIIIKFDYVDPETFDVREGLKEVNMKDL